jgi:hypothetical protein
MIQTLEALELKKLGEGKLIFDASARYSIAGTYKTLFALGLVPHSPQ